MSAPTNPISGPVAPLESQTVLQPGQPEPPLVAEPFATPPGSNPTQPPVSNSGENPPWSGWDVLGLVAMVFAVGVACILGVATAVYFTSTHATWKETITRPEVSIGGQVLAYIFTLGVMYILVSSRADEPVGQAMRWNWPLNWRAYLLAGVALELALLPFAYLLPMPKHLPIDDFFKTARDAYILAVLGILFAPLLEELFFRGFLYPVLARRFGTYVSIIGTTLAFTLIHIPQLKYSWGPVLVIFLVGIALTTVRAIKKSVAATVLMHMAYNATIFAAAFVATSGFRHMEKFNQ